MNDLRKIIEGVLAEMEEYCNSYEQPVNLYEEIVKLTRDDNVEDSTKILLLVILLKYDGRML